MAVSSRAIQRTRSTSTFSNAMRLGYPRRTGSTAAGRIREPEPSSSRGIGVLVISHNLNDVIQVADWVAVLYLGRLAAVAPIDELDTASIVELMTTGRSGRLGAAPGEPAHAASQPGARPGSPAVGTPANGTVGNHTGEAP